MSLPVTAIVVSCLLCRATPQTCRLINRKNHRFKSVPASPAGMFCPAREEDPSGSCRRPWLPGFFPRLCLIKISSHPMLFLLIVSSFISRKKLRPTYSEIFSGFYSRFFSRPAPNRKTKLVARKSQGRARILARSVSALTFPQFGELSSKNQGRPPSLLALLGVVPVGKTHG